MNVVNYVSISYCSYSDEGASGLLSCSTSYNWCIYLIDTLASSEYLQKKTSSLCISLAGLTPIDTSLLQSNNGHQLLNNQILGLICNLNTGERALSRLKLKGSNC